MIHDNNKNIPSPVSIMQRKTELSPKRKRRKQMQKKREKEKRKASIFPLPKGYFSARPIKKGTGEILKIFPITIHPDSDSRPCLFFEGFKFPFDIYKMTTEQVAMFAHNCATLFHLKPEKVSYGETESKVLRLITQGDVNQIEALVEKGTPMHEEVLIMCLALIGRKLIYQNNANRDIIATIEVLCVFNDHAVLEQRVKTNLINAYPRLNNENLELGLGTNKMCVSLQELYRVKTDFS